MYTDELVSYRQDITYPELNGWLLLLYTQDDVIINR